MSRNAAPALAEIRSIYFRATRATIQRDLDRAVALLKTLESEEDRQKAAVYMDGLSQMRSEWLTPRDLRRRSGGSPPRKRRRE